MTKVVLLLRVSTNGQDYEYQHSTLKELADRKGWEIVKVFSNKISGAKPNEERQEIIDLIDYVKNNEVDMVLATEISRIGRCTLEALKTIEFLSENKVNLYLANYNIETLDANGNVNPIARLILTICLEISSYERNLLRYRMKAGYEDYLKKRKEDKTLKLGRPSDYKKSEEQYREQYAKELSLLRKKISLRNIRAITGTSIGTLRKIRIYM